MSNYAIGLDYGTLSVRGVLMNAQDGNIVASATYAYPHGVISDYLPGTKIKLSNYWCLQDTDDYLKGLIFIVKNLVKEGRNLGIKNKEIISLGIDFTCCTVLPVTKEGVPLMKVEKFKKKPHAWVKLWKHHAAQEQADKMNRVALERNEEWLSYYGGKISSEWLFPKLLEIFEEDPEVYYGMDSFMEAGDWLVWQLTGNERKSKSCAGYKAMYQEELEGYPSKDFFEQVNPNFKNVVSEKITPFVYDLGTAAGTLTSEYAKKLNLSKEVVVAINNIDAHVCVAAAGVSKQNIMLNIIGTSSCDILLSKDKILVPGVAGLVASGAVTGYYAYETGQNSVGDIFSWFVDNQVPASYFIEAKRQEVSIYTYLENLAAKLTPGQSGLIALDWWNGNRTPLMNADLTGLLMGMTLNTKPEEIYRALIEATAFGKRVIIENFEKNNVSIDYLVFCGGLPHKNKLLNQIYADILKKPIYVSNELETGAKSSAIFSILAKYPSKTLNEIINEMKLDVYLESYQCREQSIIIYDELFRIYGDLSLQFGENIKLMKSLQQLKK